MSVPQGTGLTPGRELILDPAPALPRGVLASRVVAWVVDALVLLIIAWLVVFAIALLGVLTLGAGFILMPLAGLVSALAYAAITVGGRKQATLGMRLMGIKVIRSDGGRPDALTAAAHALLFWVAAGTMGLLALDILVGLFRSDRRLGHDLLTGLAVVDR